MPKLRTLLPALAVLALSATVSCSTGTAPIPQNPGGSPPPCNPGTQVQLSNPRSGSQGNPSSLGRVQVVANATSNVLGASWNLILLDYAGNSVAGGTLTPSASPGSFKPFANNFYLDSTVGSLFPNDVYKVYLNQSTSSCQPPLIGSFSVG